MHGEDDAQPCRHVKAAEEAILGPLPSLAAPSSFRRRSVSSAAEVPLETNKRLGMLDDISYITLKYQPDDDAEPEEGCGSSAAVAVETRGNRLAAGQR